MTQSALTFRFCYKQIDQESLIHFLDKHRKELYLPDRAAVCAVIDRVFAEGGCFAGYDPQGNIEAMMGFFFGAPDQGFAERHILFMYVAAISPRYRLTRAFHTGLRQSLTAFKAMGIHSIQLQAQASDRYTNKLYGRFARPISTGHSLRGQPVVTYGGPIEDALAYLTRGRAALAHAPAAPLTRQNAQHAAGLAPIQI